MDSPLLTNLFAVDVDEMNVRSLVTLLICLACFGCGSKASEGFKLYSLDGKKTITPDDYKGKVIVLDFWATWCEPCKMVQPAIHRWADEYGKKGVVFLGVSMEAPNVVSDYVQKKPLGYTAVIDRGQQVQDQYKFESLPSMLILDKNGAIAFSGSPFLTDKVVETLNQLTRGA